MALIRMNSYENLATVVQQYLSIFERYQASGVALPAAVLTIINQTKS